MKWGGTDRTQGLAMVNMKCKSEVYWLVFQGNCHLTLEKSTVSIPNTITGPSNPCQQKAGYECYTPPNRDKCLMPTTDMVRKEDMKWRTPKTRPGTTIPSRKQNEGIPDELVNQYQEKEQLLLWPSDWWLLCVIILSLLFLVGHFMVIILFLTPPWPTVNTGGTCIFTSFQSKT